MKILLAADGSEYTQRAAQFLAGHVAELSRKPEVFLLHVHPRMPYPGAAAAAGRGAVESYQKEQCEKALQVARAVLDGAGVGYQAEWMEGDVAECIRDYAKKIGAEMIVMGSHGHGSFLSLALGSVASKVLAATKQPVLIVR
jgi:nucleotide-binding universal stress UspA family protein